MGRRRLSGVEAVLGGVPEVVGQVDGAGQEAEQERRRRRPAAACAGVASLAGEDEADQHDGVLGPLPGAQADHEGPRRAPQGPRGRRGAARPPSAGAPGGRGGRGRLAGGGGEGHRRRLPAAWACSGWPRRRPMRAMTTSRV